MSKALTTTYVMDEPHVKVGDGKFWFTGKAVPVNVSGRVLDYLKAAGTYDSKANVHNGLVFFDNDFSISERLREVDEALAIVDRKRLESDLEKNGWAFLMAKGKPGKFKDYKDKGFMANMDRVIQELAIQKLCKEQKWKFGVRHLKAQEDVELMYSNDAFKQVNETYWKPLSEVIEVAKQRTAMQKMKGDTSEKNAETEGESLIPESVACARSRWYGFESRPLVTADWPLYRYEYGIAAFKKVAKTQ